MIMCAKGEIMALTQEHILREILEIITEITGMTTEEVVLGLDTPFLEIDIYALDALSLADILEATENRFDMKIPGEEVKALTVQKLADFIHNHHAEGNHQQQR